MQILKQFYKYQNDEPSVATGDAQCDAADIIKNLWIFIMFASV
jgi:hypothetical protein